MGGGRSTHSATLTSIYIYKEIERERDESREGVFKKKKTDEGLYVNRIPKMLVRIPL